MPVLRVLAWGLALGILAFAAATYAALPEAIPQHIALSGEVTRTAPKSFWSWFLLPLIGLAIVALCTGLAQWLPRWPHLVNLPDKERFRKLPPAYQRPVMAKLQRLLDLVALMNVGIFAALQWQLYVLAQGARSPNTTVVMLVLASVTTVVLLLQLIPIQRSLDAAERAWKAAGSPPA